jgi:hypothetical protein
MTSATCKFRPTWTYRAISVTYCNCEHCELLVPPLAMGQVDLYGPPFMKSEWQRTGDRNRPGVRMSSLMIAAAMCSATVAGCGGASASPVSPTHQRKSSDLGSAGAATTLSRSDQVIISAWLAAEKAFHDAALTSDPNAPELAATMIAPQLEGARRSLQELRAYGDIAKGRTDYGSPAIVRSDTGGAVVVSCIHGAEIEVNAKTGQPVPGELGQVDFNLVTSTMANTPDGWKLANQTVGSGQCNGS